MVMRSVGLVATLGTVLALAGCGRSDDASPVVTLTPGKTVSASPSASASVSDSPTVAPTAPATSVAPVPPVGGQGFPEGSRYWTFQDSADSPSIFAAYSKRSGDSMCLIKMYPEYSVETGTVSDVADGQQFAVNERPETMINAYVAPYTAVVTGDPNVALSMTWSQGTLLLNATDMAGASAAVAESNPGTDGMEALARITPACG